MICDPVVVERIYRELAKPTTLQAKPASVTAEPIPLTLTRADVDSILQRKRGANPAELEYAIAHAKEFALTDYERNQLGVDLSIVAAQRALQMDGRRADPAAEFMNKVLGLSETPFGLIERAWVNQQMQSGSQAIARCRNHRPPDCECWSASRAILWQASANGEKNPEAWAATRIYEFLAELELASRPERQANSMQNLGYSNAYCPDSQPAFRKHQPDD